MKNELKGMEDLATAVFACDKNLIIKYINPSAEILFELSMIKQLMKVLVYFLKKLIFLKMH